MIGDTVAHSPFDDGTREVPGDVAGTGEEVIVAVQAAVGLKDASFWIAKPRVRHHARVGDDLTFAAESGEIMARLVAAELFQEIDAGHGFEIHRVARIRIGDKFSRAEGAVFGNT